MTEFKGAVPYLSLVYFLKFCQMQLSVREEILSSMDLNGKSFVALLQARISVRVRFRTWGHTFVADFLADYRVYLGALMHCWAVLMSKQNDKIRKEEQFQ